MNELKFELSVLFTKTELSPYRSNDLIKQGYKDFFGKEVNEEDLERILGEIIQENIEMYNNYVQEIPDDYELNE